MLFRGGTEPGKRDGGILERKGSVVVMESWPMQAPLSKDDSGEAGGRKFHTRVDRRRFSREHESTISVPILLDQLNIGFRVRIF
ncbi:hypothetical protein F2P79_009126 [Pimephales promelas]|nr:hypothetical protein F2P79_009126 [Pimephales promelas]